MILFFQIVFMNSKDIKSFFLVQYGQSILSLLIALGLEFVPTRISQFIEGDLTISHTCGNTVR